jgi:hypothetical protein
MHWRLSWRADPRARRLADRHYNRRRPGSSQFVPPGKCIVLVTSAGEALWVSSWQLPEWVKHAWRSAWVCTCFRNESWHLSSDLIRQAVAVTRWFWPEPPLDGMVTFVNPRLIRKKRDPGRCFRRAGWIVRGWTPRGLLVLQLPPEVMPGAQPPLHWKPLLWTGS